MGLGNWIRRHPWFVALVLMVLPFLLFWQVWWPDVQQRQVFAYGDFVEQFYLPRVFVAREWRSGHMPLWDPYSYAGQPVLAQSLTAAMYPLGLWLALFRAPFPLWALEVEAIVHLGLAGLFTYLFVRRLTGSLAAGLMAGITFGLGGFLTSYPVLQVSILETAVWLPAGLWLTEWALARRSAWGFALPGAMLGCGILAGHPQICLYSGYMIGVYLLFRSWRLGWKPCAIIAAVAVLSVAAVAVGAVQWLPSIELTRLSPRAHLTYTEASGGFAWSELAGLLRPNPGQWSPLYVGVVALLLALVGLRRSPTSEMRFWALVAVVATLLSLGGKGFIYPLAYRLLPGFALFRNQERAAFLVSLSLSVLAGYGYAALGGVRGWTRIVLPLLLLVTFLDLFHANTGINVQKPVPGGYLATIPSLQYLQSIAQPNWRMSSEDLLPGDGNAGMRFQLRDVTGNSPLHLAAYDQFLAQVPETRWWQLLDVQFLVTRRTLDNGAVKLLLESGDQHLYQLFFGGRSAWLTHDFRLATDGVTAIQLAADPSLNPLETVVLEQAPSPAPRAAVAPEDVQMITLEHQKVVIRARLSSPAVLVLSEVAYPGWNVYVNGQKTRALRAFGLLRAVALPAGEYKVEWLYEPVTVRIGLTVSLLAALGVGMLCWKRETLSPQPGRL